MYSDDAGDRTIYHTRSPESICDEILWLREKVPVKMVAFVDDVFTLHRKWTLRFCEHYAERVRLPFSINARFDNLDAEMVQALAEAGLCLAYAGVESGDERIRNEVMQRRMTEESIVDGAALFRKNGVKLLTENILGVPGETLSSAMETLRVNQVIRPEVANASIFTPYPKLPLTAYAIEHDYFDGDFDKLSGNYYHETVIRFDSERERRQIVNLRCFFSLLARHPRLLSLFRPLLKLKPNRLFQWAGDLLDGFYLKRCLPYRFTLRGFLVTFLHWARWYR
jgi:anaerobic magnesium-protoporphyrin IX monomethyl ester cyclase